MLSHLHLFFTSSLSHRCLRLVWRTAAIASMFWWHRRTLSKEFWSVPFCPNIIPPLSSMTGCLASYRYVWVCSLQVTADELSTDHFSSRLIICPRLWLDTKQRVFICIIWKFSVLASHSFYCLFHFSFILSAGNVMIFCYYFDSLVWFRYFFHIKTIW